MGYIGPETYTPAGTIKENLLYVLKHYPQRDGTDPNAAKTINWLKEAKNSGNSLLNIDADWVDYSQINISGPDELTDKVLAVLPEVDIEEDVFQLGLRRIIEPEKNKELTTKLIEVKPLLLQHLVEMPLYGKYSKNLGLADVS